MNVSEIFQAAQAQQNALGPYTALQQQAMLGSLVGSSTSVTQVKTQSQVQEERTTMLQEFRKFVAEHRDLIFTVLLLLAVDYLAFNGALRERLEGLLRGVADRLTKKVETTLGA